MTRVIIFMHVPSGFVVSRFIGWAHLYALSNGVYIDMICHGDLKGVRKSFVN